MVSLPFVDTGILKIGGVTIHGLTVNRAGIELENLYPLMSGALIVCVGEAVTAKFAIEKWLPVFEAMLDDEKRLHLDNQWE